MKRLTVIVLLGSSLSACFFGEPRVYQDAPRLVPDVVGERVAEASLALEEEGLIVEIETREREPGEPASCPDAEVLAQDVVPGEATVSGTIVTLTVTDCSSAR